MSTPLQNTDFFENITDRANRQDVNALREKFRAAVSEHLGRTTYEAKQNDLRGVLNYLAQDDFHFSEGRDLSFNKQSYSVTELLVADQYQNEEDLVHYLLYRYRFNHYPRHKVNSDFPIVLCIEPTSVCNLRCTMCFQADASFSGDKSLQGMMDFETFKRVIDEGKKFDLSSIVLASRGEPLLNKNIFKMIAYAKANGVLDVKMNTNATYLTAEASRKLLEAGLDNLVFSVDSAVKEEYESIRIGAKFDKVIENIRTFHEVRKNEFPNAKTRTRVSMIVVDENQDVEYAKQFWSELVDEFAYRKVIERLEIYSKDERMDTRPCSLLWERMYVWFDGTVSICDEDYKSVLSPGKFAEDTSLHGIWTGEHYQKLRDTHLALRKNDLHPCNKCPGF